MDINSKRTHFNKRVLEIVPYLYFELIENYLTLKPYKTKSLDTIIHQGIHFNTTNWHLYKGEVSEWREINIIPLSRINYDLDRLIYIIEHFEDSTNN